MRRLLLSSLILLQLTYLCHCLDDDGTCQLLTLIPFHNDKNRNDLFMDRWPSDVMAYYGYTYLAAALLAIRHFNERDGSIVSELTSIQMEHCPVHFPNPVVVDSAQTDTKSILGILTPPPPRTRRRQRRDLIQQQEYSAQVHMGDGSGRRPSRRPELDEGEEEGVNNFLLAPPVPPGGSTSTTEATNEDECSLESIIPRWCAVIGPTSGRTYGHLSSLTSAFSIPQIAYHQMSDMLMGQSVSPSTIGLAMSSSGQAQAIMSWCIQTKRHHLAVIYTPPPHLQELARSLRNLSHNTTITTATTSSSSGWDDDINDPLQFKVLTKETQGGNDHSSIDETVQFIKSSGIKTILLAVDTPEELKIFAESLQRHQLLGPPTNDYTNDYVYILLEKTISVDALPSIFGYLEPGTPLDNLLNGAVVMSPIDNHIQTNDGKRKDAFLEVWKTQNYSLVRELNALVPKDERTGLPLYHGDASFFQTKQPAHMASYVYDAVMSVGFGACRKMHWMKQQQQQQQQQQNRVTSSSSNKDDADNARRRRKLQVNDSENNRTSGYRFDEEGYLIDDNSSPKEPTLVDSILQSSFTGASGPVQFMSQSSSSLDDMGRPPLKTRAPNGPFMGSFNIRPNDSTASNHPSGHRTYTSTLTSYMHDSRVTTTRSDQSWSDPGLWTPVSDDIRHVYRSGTTEPPEITVEIMDQNFLTRWVQAMGLVLFALALILGLGSMFFVWYLRKDAKMRAGQPLFLGLLCFGAALMSVSIFTLSFDESYGWSQVQLEWACVMTPWFFFVGHLLMFGSLYTKLWRVDKVMKFKRGQVITKRQVALPLVIVLLVAMAILTSWSLVDPWLWERTVIQDTPYVETYGACRCEHFAAWSLSLVSVMIVGKLSAAVMAWKTADIPRQYSDTSSAYYAISTHLQAWFIALPILLVLGVDSADAVYFGRVLIIWIFSVSGVAIVVVPKILKCFHYRRHPELQRRKGRVTVSGLASEMTESSNYSSDFYNPSSSSLGSRARGSHIRR